MAGTLYDANNVKVGNAFLFLKKWVPGEDIEFVADDVPLWNTAAWEALGFISAGATNEGFKINAESSTTTITIEEQPTPVGEEVEGRTLRIEAALAEDTMEVIRMAWGGGPITVQAASSTLVGTRKMRLSTVPEYWIGCLETMNLLGMPRRFCIPKLSAIGSGETSFRRAADKRLYPIGFGSLCRPDEVEIIDVVAPKTA